MQRIRNPFVLPRLVALLSLWLALVIARSAHAGTYSVTYSGGSIVLTNPGSTSTNAYYLNNGNWGGNGSNSWYAGNASVAAQGAITATFTWQAATPDDLPPLSAIVVENSSASYTFQGVLTSQSCADGFGDTPVATGSGVASSGVRYTVKSNPGQSFNVTCSPAVSVAGAYPNAGYASVYVYYNAAAVPVQIIDVGTTRFSNADNILIGQGVNVSLSAGGYTQSGWTWTISGDPFAGFVTTATSGNAVELTAADKQKASLTYFYRSVSGGNSTVTCSATITFPNGTSSGVTATKSINVMQPTFKFTPTAGTTDLWNVVVNNPPTTQVFLEPFNTVTKQGIVFAGIVTTPSVFVGESSGVWGIAQLITPALFVTDLDGTVVPSPANGPQGLDGVFTYAKATGPADGTKTNIGDTPGVSLDSSIIKGADDSNTFQSYFLYQPPASTGGTGVTWVPLYEIDWNWHGIATFNSDIQRWQLSAASNGVNITTQTLTTTLPTWTRAISGN